MEAFPYEQIIVIGGTGQTGHRVIEGALQFTPRPRIVATSRAVADGLPAGALAPTVLPKARQWMDAILWKALDLDASTENVVAQLQTIKVALADRPTALVFASAFTNVEGCETDPEKCHRINEKNTIQVLQWARDNFGAKLVFYSTDYVFDGTQGPYTERAERKAISVYGAAKANVEHWIETHASDSLILRTTGVFDYLQGSKNFLMQMIELWKDAKVTRIPRDQYSNPVWAKDLATATLKLLKHRASGIYNVAGGLQMSRVEWAQAIARHYKLDESLIQPVVTDALGQKAKRPLRGGLRLDKLESEIGWAPLSAPEALKRL